MNLYSILYQTPKYATLKNIFLSNNGSIYSNIVGKNFFDYLNNYFFQKQFFIYFYTPRLDLGIFKKIIFIDNLNQNKNYIDLIIPPDYFNNYCLIEKNNSLYTSRFNINNSENLLSFLINLENTKNVKIEKNVIFKDYFYSDELFQFFHFSSINFPIFINFIPRGNFFQYFKIYGIFKDLFLDNLDNSELSNFIEKMINSITSINFTTGFKNFILNYISSFNNSLSKNIISELLSNLVFLSLSNNKFLISEKFSQYFSNYYDNVLTDYSIRVKNIFDKFSGIPLFYVLLMNVLSYVEKNNLGDMFVQLYFLNSESLIGDELSDTINLTTYGFDLNIMVELIRNVISYWSVFLLSQYFKINSDLSEFINNFKVITDSYNSLSYSDAVKNLFNTITDFVNKSIGPYMNADILIVYDSIFSFDESDIGTAVTLWILNNVLFNNFKGVD